MNIKQILIATLVSSMLFSNGYGQSMDQSGQAYENRMMETSQESEGVTFHHAPRREAMPLQIRLVGSFGAATPNSFAPGMGIHLGYQLSDSLYLGLTTSSYIEGRNITDDYRNYSYEEDDDIRYDSGKIYGQDGAYLTESELKPVHLLDLRVTPWDFGLYFSVGVLYRGSQSSTTEFKSESRTIGDNIYTADLTAKVEYKEWYGAATGVGYNYIFSNGLTLGTGFTLGLGSQDPDVTVSSSTAVSDADLAYWKKQIQTNERQTPYLFTFSIGYAL